MSLVHLPERLKVWHPPRGNTVQQPESTGALHAAQAFFTLNGLVLGLPAPGYSCSGSSDSSTAGLDGANRVASKANVVSAAAAAHTWVVWKSTAAGFQVCVDFNTANNWTCSVVFSPQGLFSGGSTTARPTASDEIVVRNGLDWLIGNSTAKLNLTAFHTTDGLNTAVFFTTASGKGVQAELMMGRAHDARTFFTVPTYLRWYSTGTSAGSYTPSKATNPAAQDSFAVKGPTANDLLRCTGGVYLNNQYLWSVAAQNSLTGAWEVEQPGLFKHAVPDVGRYGVLPDHLICQGPTTGNVGRDPNVPDRLAIQLGVWAMPWVSTMAWEAP